MIRRASRIVILAALILGAALPASANPIVFVAMTFYPLMILGLIPIIAAEACLLRVILAETWPRALKSSGLAYLCSTLFGIPLSWVLQAFLQMATIGVEPSLIDNSYKPPPKALDYIFGAASSYGGDYWDIQVKALVCLALAYLIAVPVEYGVHRLVLKPSDPAKLRKCAWLTNGATYAPLFALFLGLLAYQAITGAHAEGFYAWLERLIGRMLPHGGR